jgi:hypothetical protein
MTAPAPFRDVDLTRARALLEHLGTVAGGRTPSVQAMEQVLLARFASDRRRWSDVLEPSFSYDASGTHLYRFSYAFPGFRADPQGVAATMRALAAPFGERVLDAAGTVLRAARSTAVEQPLFGFAHDGAGRTRVKFYLQFRPEASSAALDLAERMLGLPLRAHLDPAGALHLLGLDLSADGLLVGAKLYLLHPRLRTADCDRVLGPVPLVDALAAQGVRELRQVLAIHRLDGPASPPSRPVEIDFALAENDLSWRTLRLLPPIADALAASPALHTLETSFRLAIRRLSASVGSASKLNVYYVLTEREPHP